MIRRRFALIISIFFVLFLLAGFVHAAQHLKHGCHVSCSHDPQEGPPAQGGCPVCAFFCHVFKALSKGLAALFILLTLHFGQRRLEGMQPSCLEILPLTPVSLRVKMNN